MTGLSRPDLDLPMLHPVWTWIVGGLAVWVIVAVALGVVLGRGIRLANRNSPGTASTVR